MKTIGIILAAIAISSAAPALAQPPRPTHVDPTGDGTVSGQPGDFRQFLAGFPAMTLVTIKNTTDPQPATPAYPGHAPTAANSGAIEVYRCKVFQQSIAASQCDMSVNVEAYQTVSFMLQDDVMFAASAPYGYRLTYHYEIIGDPQGKVALPQ